MKKEYITPSSRVIRLRNEGMVATSDPDINNEYSDKDDLSNRRTSTLIWGEDE